MSFDSFKTVQLCKNGNYVLTNRAWCEEPRYAQRFDKFKKIKINIFVLQIVTYKAVP
jgi:hypothetical protein